MATTELILLMLASTVMLFGLGGGGFVFKGQEMLESGVPSLAIRMEKHLITGHLFSLKEGENDQPVWGN